LEPQERRLDLGAAERGQQNGRPAPSADSAQP
jgi:hypothetical protein